MDLPRHSMYIPTARTTMASFHHSRLCLGFAVLAFWVLIQCTWLQWPVLYCTVHVSRNPADDIEKGVV